MDHDPALSPALRPGRLDARLRGHRRVPAFAPVPLRGRADGWTPTRQAAFLAALALTGSVRAAAQRVGMSRETAYRLRRRPEARSFAQAWDAALRRPANGSRKVTPGEIALRARSGLLKPVIHAGRHVATLWKPDNSALLRHLRQLDQARPGDGDRPLETMRFAPCVMSTSPARRR